MTIKYNGQDLVRRIINWHDVEKVMYNGIQIRPSSPTPTPTYHIMWDFASAWASGQLPSGWTMTAWTWTATIDSNWVTTDSNWNWVYLNIDNYPSATRASRIVVEIWFTATSQWGFASLIKSSNYNQVLAFYWWDATIKSQTSGILNSDSTWLTIPYTWTLTGIWNICDGELWLQIENLEFVHDLNNTDINTLRTSTWYELQMSWYSPITISSIDYYLWNTPIKRANKRVNAEINSPYTYYFTKNGTVTPYISYDSNMLEVTPDLSNSLYVITPKALWDTSITIWADQSFSNYQYDTLYFHITN